jgi:uncharacterized protein YhaN
VSSARKTIIESLRVDGFGRFHDFELELGDGLNVLAGPNEAGKSTLWSFISAMLFGFERRSEASRYEPVGGAAFGGEVRLKTSGGRVIVRRQGHKRRADGEMTLRDATGAPLPDSRLDEARGQVSRELFAQVFSLTIDQLRSFGDLAGSEVSERLFAAAMQGAQRLPAALESLRKEGADLFLPKGQRPLNVWLRELQGVRLQLEALGDRPAAYAHDRAQRSELEALLLQLEGEFEIAQRSAREHERAQKAMGPLQIVRRAESAQKGHEALSEFPLEAAARVEALVKTLHEASNALHVCQQEVSQLDAQVQATEHALASQARPEPIRAALRQWDTVMVQARELPAALAQLEASQRHLTESMKRLPVPSADVAWLSTVDVGVAVQTELKSLRDRHAQAREERARVMAALTSARDEFARREARAHDLEREVNAIALVDAGPLEEAVKALNRVSGLTQQQAHLATQRVGLAAQVQALEVPPGSAPRARLPLWLAGVGTVALLVCSMVAWAAGAGPSALLFAGVLGLMALVAAWRDEHGTVTERAVWERARQHQHAQREARKTELGLVEVEAAEVAEQLGQALRVGGAAEVNDVANRIAWARRAIDEQERRGALARSSAEARGEQARVRDVVTGLEAERARADAALDAVQIEVDERLAPVGISASLSAEAALDVVADVHRLQERALQLETQRAGLAAETSRVQRAVGALQTQARAVGLTAEAEPVVLASMLGDWLDADTEQRTRLNTARTRREAASGPLAAHQASVAQATQALSGVLQVAGVDSVEAFRHRANEAQLWQAHEVERRQACATIAALGAELSELKGLDAATVPTELEAANQRLEALRLRREQALESLGRLRARLETFEVEDEAAALRREEEALVLRIRQGAEQYTLTALARAVLEQTRERFDAEQQPRVVLRAAALFAQLTNNRYVHVRPDARARELTVRDAQGVTWQVEQLSRGTRELLLLAFRLAVVEDFGEVRVALPVLLDDVTVNLDADRAARVIEVLATLSKRHQILAFTCHSPVRALFREAGAKVHEVVQRTQLSLLGA